MLQIISRANGIVPVTMKIIFDYINGCKLSVGNLDALRIFPFVQFSLYRKPRFCFCVGDQIEHNFMTDQGFSSPVHGYKGEQSVFNLVPFAGSWRIMTNPNGNADFICKPLQLQLPQSDTTTITPTAVCSDKQFFGIGICLTTNDIPPSSYCLHGKCGRIMIGTDTPPSFIGANIVNAIRIGTSCFFNKIMNLYFCRFSLGMPCLSIVLETPDQFLLFGVNRNDRLPIGQSIRYLGIYMLELDVPIRMTRSFKSFFVPLQAISELDKQLPDMGMADSMPLFAKFLGQSPQTFAGPAKRRIRIATSHRFNQQLKVDLQGDVGFSDALSACTGPSDPRTSRPFFKMARFKLFQTSMYRTTGNARRRGHDGDSSPSQYFGFRR